MKISIDTKEDSADDIKRVVKMLQAWVEGHTNAPFDMFSSSGSESGSSDSSPAVSPGLFNIFNDDNKPEDNDDSDMPQVINLDDIGKSDDIPPVITY